MSDQTIDCYIIPSAPAPLLMPVECIAEVTVKPLIEELSDASASWMIGHVNWRTQRLPVMSYETLHDPDFKSNGQAEPHLVVLNPIPNAARKAYSGLLCHGEVKQITVDTTLDFSDLDGDIDRRYIDGMVKIGKDDYVVPKLAALGVAFSYF